MLIRDSTLRFNYSGEDLNIWDVTLSQYNANLNVNNGMKFGGRDSL